MTLCGHSLSCVCVCVCVCSLSALVRNPNGETSRETGSGREKEGQRRAKEDSRREIAVQEKDGQQKEAVKEDSQRWVGIRSGFCRGFEQSIRSQLSRDARRMQSVTKLLFLRLELTQVRVCSFILSSTLSVVFYVAIKKCVIPLVGNEKEKNQKMNHWPRVVWFKDVVVGIGR